MTGAITLPKPSPGFRRRAIAAERAKAKKRTTTQELKECRAKLERLRAEVKTLRSAGSFAENVRLREEQDRLRKALSFIAHAPRAKEMTAAELRQVAGIALEPRR